MQSLIEVILRPLVAIPFIGKVISLVLAVHYRLLRLRWKEKPLYTERFSDFLLIGGISTSLQFVLLLELSRRVDIFYATGAAVIGSAFLNFFCNFFYTWRDRFDDLSRREKAVCYMPLFIVFLLTTPTLYLKIFGIGELEKFGVPLIVSFAITEVIGVIANFIIADKFLFGAMAWMMKLLLTKERGHGVKMKQILKGMRVKQWMKNVFVLAPVLYLPTEHQSMIILRLAALFVAISFAASSVYLVNDILDVEKDRLHPKKRYRPLAAGQMSIRFAIMLSSALATVSLSVSFVLGWKILIYMLTYIILSHCYSLRLKHVPYVEVLIVGGLYAIRVLVGFSAAHMQPAGWLIWVILTFFLATFMQVGNRYSEMKAVDTNQTRKVLESYTDSGINRFWLAFSIGTISLYPLASWNVSPFFFLSTIVVIPMVYVFYRTLEKATEHMHPQDAIMQSRGLKTGFIVLGFIYLTSIVR